MDRHDQTHNDIKPSNFLVKFKNGQDDLTNIEIVLTDFGMAGPERQGGTPIFASPECFEKKEKKSDIFSFGRVILFLLLSKQRFLKWLFVPIQNSNSPSLDSIITRLSTIPVEDRMSLSLIGLMTSNGMVLKRAREIFNELRFLSLIRPTSTIIAQYDSIVNVNLSNFMNEYISELAEFR